MEKRANKRAAGAILICSKTGRVLLNLRASHKSHRLTWGLWGGMMEEGEEPKDCLLRELKEEIGFIPKITRMYPFDVFQSKDGEFFFYTFVFVVTYEFNPELNDESDGYSWVNLGVWPKPMHYGARRTLCNKKSLEKLRLILDQHKEDYDDDSRIVSIPFKQKN